MFIEAAVVDAAVVDAADVLLELLLLIIAVAIVLDDTAFIGVGSVVDVLFLPSTSLVMLSSSFLMSVWFPALLYVVHSRCEAIVVDVDL